MARAKKCKSICTTRRNSATGSGRRWKTSPTTTRPWPSASPTPATSAGTHSFTFESRYGQFVPLLAASSDLQVVDLQLLNPEPRTLLLLLKHPRHDAFRIAIGRRPTVVVYA